MAAAGLAAFLGHESLLVLLGQRGGRAAREQHADARWSFAIFGLVAAISGVAAILLISPPARVALAVPAFLAALLASVVAIGKERTTAGEMLVAMTLSSLSLSTALAGGVPWLSALTVALVFCLIFLIATIAVRAIIASRTRDGPSRAVAVLVTVGAIVSLAALSAAGAVHPVATFATLPVSGVALWLVADPPSPRYLRRVGWTLVSATALTAIILVRTLR